MSSLRSKHLFNLSGRISPKRGTLRTLQMTVSTDLEKGLITRYLIRSSGRLETIHEVLFGKWLWDELTFEENSFFLTIPKTFKDPLVMACLMARAKGVPKKVIRERVEKIPFKVSKPKYLRYKTLLGRLFLSVELQTATLRSTPKYSGWARHHNDKGSLRSPSMDGYFILPEWSDDVVNEEGLILEFLTTGRIQFFGGST